MAALDDALFKLLVDELLALDDERMLELTLLDDERLDELKLAGAELVGADEVITTVAWLDDDTVAALNAAISFLTLFNACAACAWSGWPTATPQGAPKQLRSGFENLAMRPLALLV